MKLCMIGTGYVGLVSGVCFSDLGNEVICVDKDDIKINNLNDYAMDAVLPSIATLAIYAYTAELIYIIFFIFLH